MAALFAVPESWDSMPKNGVVHLPSPYSFEETLGRLEALLRQKGITLFCRVDHGGEAAKAGLKMNPAQLFIFGNPKAGTPVMVAAPTAAIDLPLKALVWADGAGKVWVSYNDSQYLRDRHHIPGELVENLAGVAALLQGLVKAA